jgi:hypothetical protein
MGINFKDTRGSLEQVAQDLERSLKEQESPVSGAKAPASHTKESQVLFELAKFPLIVQRMQLRKKFALKPFVNMVFKMCINL